MICHARLAFLATAAVLLAFPTLDAQVTAPVTALDKQLSRLDLSVQGAGLFTRGVSGPITPTGAPNFPSTLSESPSNTLGALVSVRYVARSFVGFEVNYGYARYTETFNTLNGINVAPGSSTFQIQTQANEFTAGYVATPAHPIFGFQPFVSAGLGSMEFKPTRGGGQGAPNQFRAAYYYSVGLQQEYLSSHFGLRASFRQVLFNAPDFLQNYLTINKRTLSTEPTAGFYLRF